MAQVLHLNEINSEDLSKVGKKSANLGELEDSDIPVLPGFSTTSNAYRSFLTDKGLKQKIENLLEGVEPGDIEDLQRRGEKVRAHIKEAELPQSVREKVLEAYRYIEDDAGKEDPEMAVRSSLDSGELEHVPEQQEYVLGVSGSEELIDALKECYASFFSNRAIAYREENGIDHFELEPCILVQKLGSGENGASGEMTSCDPESGFENVISITSSYGMGSTDRTDVEPDSFTVFKQNYSIIERENGGKKVKAVKDGSGDIVTEEVPSEKRGKFSLTDNQVKELAKYSSRIENHFDEILDIEWLFDSREKQIYILDVDTEDSWDRRENVIEKHILEEESDILVEGESVGSKIASGEVHVLNSPRQLDRFTEGDILVTDSTGPEWEPLMEKSGAVVTNKGGRASHTAIFSRELDVPAVVGARDATSRLSDGEEVTIDCSSADGKVWREELQHTWEEHDLEKLPETDTAVNINIEDPDQAFEAAKLPAETAHIGIGDVILSDVEEHPLKLIEEDREEEYVKKLEEGIGKVGAAFYPGDVRVRLNDLTSEQFRELQDGEEFEEKERNPDLGFRGASRLYHQSFSDVFELECQALRQCIDELGLENISVTVPFCRNIEEAKNVKAKMKEYGLDRGDIEIYLAVETPGNIVRAEEYSEIFDGFSVDLESITRLTLGLDRDTQELNPFFDERDPAVRETVKHMVQRASAEGKEVGVVGDLAEEHERYLDFLVENGADWISVSEDHVLRAIWKLDEIENLDTGDAGYEFDVEGMVGTPAGHVHEALESHGHATAEKLRSLTPDKVDLHTIHQALGWLASEGKIVAEQQGGNVVYRLK